MQNKKIVDIFFKGNFFIIAKALKNKVNIKK